MGDRQVWMRLRQTQTKHQKVNTHKTDYTHETTGQNRWDKDRYGNIREARIQRDIRNKLKPGTDWIKN